VVANISNFDTATGGYSISVISSTTLNAYATSPSPQAGVAADNAADTGAVFHLGLSVPVAGNHVIYIVSDSATIFRNNNISANPYPFTIPGVFSTTGNSAITTANPDLYKQYYYFFYDMRIKTTNCPGGRVQVVANTAPAPVISLAGNVLTSTAASGYQWYLNGKLLAGATGKTDTALITGSYSVVATDSFGCSQASNSLIYASDKGGAISLLVHPNPSNGQFAVNFVTSKMDNVDLILLNTLGQEVYKQHYPNFSGPFASQVNTGNLSPGVYYLKVLVGKNAYLQKVLIVR
jgi:hypothetical protein